MQKNILITGASGFIGSFLVEAAIERGYRVFAGVRSSSNRQWLTHPDIYFLEMDLDNRHQLEMVLQQTVAQYGRFDYIIHAAGLTKTLDHFAFTKVNFGGTQNLVEALQHEALIPGKFIFISSLASYGPGASGSQAISETDPQHPVTAYGRSKQLAEAFLLRHTEMPSVIVNPTTVYGPRDKDFFFLIQSIRKGWELYLGNKNQRLSFVHVQDLVQAVFLVTESDITGRRILVSDLKNYVSAEMNYLLKKLTGRKTVSLTIPFWLAGAAAFFSEFSGRLSGKTPLLNRERLKEFKAPNWAVDATPLRALGYEPKYELEKGLADVINWYSENGWLK